MVTKTRANYANMFTKSESLKSESSAEIRFFFSNIIIFILKSCFDCVIAIELNVILHSWFQGQIILFKISLAAFRLGVDAFNHT